MNDYQFTPSELVNLIDSILGYRFKDERILQQAFTFPSFAQEHPEFSDNEILEWIGDAELQRYVTRYFSDMFVIRFDSGVRSKKSEGELTELRKKYVCGEYLAMRVDNLELAKPELLRLGYGDIKNGIHNLPHIKENLAEALIGAIAFDSNYDNKVLNHCLGKLILPSPDRYYKETKEKILYNISHVFAKAQDFSANGERFSFVNALQELWRMNLITQPIYGYEERTDCYETIWHVTVSTNIVASDMTLSVNTNNAAADEHFSEKAFSLNSKKEAKKIAAQLMLYRIQNYCRHELNG